MQWCTFENTVIRLTASKWRLDFLHDLDEWFSSADLWRKYAFLSKNGREKNIIFVVEIDHFDVFLPKNSIPGAKNSLKCENFDQFHFLIGFIRIKSG